MEKRGRSMHSDLPTCGALGAADVDLQFGSESRTESDPPAPDPLEDMDCGEDRQDACLIPSAEADASMHSITDTIAPHERTALMRCMVDHGLREHDSHDSKTEACS